MFVANLKVLPRQASFEKVNQQINDWNQIVSTALLKAFVRIHARIASRSHQAIELFNLNMFSIRLVSFRETEVY